SYTHVLQFLIIMSTMLVAFTIVVSSLPAGVGFGDAVRAAGALGRMNAIDLHFDPNNRYTLWSGLIGGFFLQLSYFGADQSQVGRYLTGRSVAESRLGLLFNAMAKVPMQFGILFLGVMVFVFYLFVTPPLFFNPAETARLAASMDSISAESDPLTSTTVVDVLKRMPFGGWTDRADLVASRLVTLGWAGFAVLFADFVSGLGTLVEAVNILGSLFYGTVLGIFLTAFWLERVGGTAVFVGALVAEAAVVACFKLTSISFLWYNLIGCALVMLLSLA